MGGELRDRTEGRGSQAAADADDAARQRLRTLAYELTLAEARERGRIARDLHDELGQLLAAASFKVGELRHCPPKEHLPRLQDLADLLKQASRATRSATFDLGRPALQLGLDEALRELAQHLSRHGEARFAVEGRLPSAICAEPVLSVIYRVVRELALNAQRHAKARQVWIRLMSDAAQMVISVDDDGVGVAPDWAGRGLSREGGFGLISAHAQMQALGGSLVLESGAGSGTRATVVLPLSQATGA